MKQSTVKRIVWEAIREEFGTKTTPLTEQQITQIEQTRLDEGLGSAVIKSWAFLKGASRGAGIGFTQGAAIGTSASVALIAQGLVPASSLLIPSGLIVGAVGSLQGLWVGGQKGLDLARRATQKEHEKLATKLIEITNRRDDAIKAASENPQMKDEIDKLTQHQQKVQVKFLKELEWSFNKGFVQMSEYEAMRKICTVAARGKLTYLTEK